MGKKKKKIVLDDWIDIDISERLPSLPPAFEVGDVLRQVEEVLLAGPQRSPVLVGRPGVGKSAIFHALIRRVANGEGPEALRGARVVQIGLASIAGRFPPNTGKATDFAQRLFDHLLERDEPIIPLIRDIHVAYHFDWEAILHRYLSRSKLPILAEAQPRQFDELVEYWSDLNDFLVPIAVTEPNAVQVRSIVRQWDVWSETQGERPFTDEAQRVVIELTARYMGDRAFPRKVLDLLRQTRVLASNDAAEGPIDVPAVIARFSSVTRVPPNLIDPRERLDLDDVERFMSTRLLGQEEAVEALMRMIALIKAGLTDVSRPFGVLLFVGPTGVGKTHAAQLLAEYLFGDRQRLIRVNMTDYTEPAHFQTLFGDPHGQNLSQKRGVLASRLVGQPFGVLLLDEFEKANPRVHDGFLQLIDEGRFINGMGETVSATSMILIATSNAGVEVFRETGLGFRNARDLKSLDAELDRRLLQTFRFEFLNRFDHVVHFHPLDRNHIRSIARRELGELIKREGMARRKIELEVSTDVLDWLVAHGYHPHFGARFLRREIERNITAALADFIVRHEPEQGAQLDLCVRHGRIVVQARDVEPAMVTVPRADAPRDVKVDAEALEIEAQAWLERFTPLEQEGAARAGEASALIAQSQRSGFWDQPDSAQGVMKRYKVLDARLQADARLLEPVRAVRQAFDADGLELDVLAGLVSEMAVSYRRWLDLGAEEAPNGVWLIVGPSDPLHPEHASAWLGQLVRMYRGWLSRRGFTWEIAAEEVVNGEVLRVVFEVEGAGVMRTLEMEQGLHRRKRLDGSSARVNVDLIPRRESEPTRVPADMRVTDARRSTGEYVERIGARLRLKVPARGIEVTLRGVDRPTLTLLGDDLLGYMGAPAPVRETARTYGVIGGTARDPRTRASSSAIKDVLRGNLETFLRAWEVHA
ncbi:MAG: ATP-dependent Clp protease ATP-binding subunit ClpC [Bradymonadia bacterium]|jgi:ATP-dependent Clp protease ATP-binding subunit ClpC